MPLHNSPKPPARNIILGSRILKAPAAAAAAPNGNAPGGLVVHRRPVGGFWGGIGTLTANGTAVPPPNGTAPFHLVIGRRLAARAVWSGTTVRTVNAGPPAGRQPGGLIRRRAAARAVTRGLAAPFPPPNGTTPDRIVVARRQAARAVWRGTVSSTTNAAAVVVQLAQYLAWRPKHTPSRGQWHGTTVRTVNATPATPVSGTVPLHLVVARRQAARAVWHPTATETTNLLSGNQPGGLIRRRTPARAVARGVAAPFPPPTGTAPGHLVVARRTAARAVWRGTVPATVNATPAAPVSGTAPDHLVIARRGPARAVARGTVVTTANAAPSAPVSGTVPDHVVVARRQAARVIWRGTTVRTSNATPPNGTVQPRAAVPVPRRAPARAAWHGNAVPPRRPQAATGGLVRRRPPARGRWTGTVSRTANAPPPPFTVGTLTAQDAALATLTGTTAAGGSGGVLTASDQRTGGPGG